MRRAFVFVIMFALIVPLFGEVSFGNVNENPSTVEEHEENVEATRVELLELDNGSTLLNQVEHAIKRYKDIRKLKSLNKRLDYSIKRYERSYDRYIAFADKYRNYGSRYQNRVANFERIAQLFLARKAKFDYYKAKVEQKIFLLENPQNEQELGKIILTEDNSNEDNEFDKVILAGESKVIFSVDISAENESIEIEELSFIVSGVEGNELRHSIKNTTLLLDDKVIDTNHNGDNIGNIITFDDLNDLVIEEGSNQELRLQINTANIGFEEVGKTLKNLQITKVELNDLKGFETGDDLEEVSLSVNGPEFNIVAGILNPSVNLSLSNSTSPELRLNLNTGDNKKANNNSSPVALIDELVFSTRGSNGGNISYTLVNTEDSSDSVIGTSSGSILVFDLKNNLSDNNRTVSTSNETYRIMISGTDEDTIVSLRLLSNGVRYSLPDIENSNDLEINLEQELNFGTRQY